MSRKNYDDQANTKITKGVMPDLFDEKNIRNLIAMWNKKHPRGQYQYLRDQEDPRKVYIEYMNIYDHLDYMRKVVRQDRKFKGITLKGKGDPINLSTSLPPAFAAELRKGYPILLTDKKQSAWFLRKFPEFKLQ